MKRTWVKRLLITLTILFVLGVVGSVSGVVGIFWWYGRGVADLDEDRLKNYRPPQVTRIYARDGELIGEIYSQRRSVVDYESIPSHVENAFLAAEDADFYRHEGMDYMGMVRALIANVRAGKVRQGASTITQQVVKVFMLSSERSFERKVQELILARRLEKAFTKQEILELYLNEIYLGHGRYGIEEASWFYFGKGIADIDIGQAALLATLPKAPGRDSPLQNPEKAKTRQVYVLEQMVKHGFATTDQVEAFIDAPLSLATGEDRRVIEAGAEEFVDEVKSQLHAHYGDDLDTLGGRVTATVSLPIQLEAHASVIKGLAEIDGRNGYGRKLSAAEDKDKAAAHEAAPAKLRAGQRLLVEVTPTPAKVTSSTPGFSARLGSHHVFVEVPEGSRYDDPEQSHAEQFVPGALVRIKIRDVPADESLQQLPPNWAVADVDAGPESAVVLADVESGEVLAMVGGSQYARAQFNRALQAKRQPGSSFKPFVYGAALTSKKWTAATLVSDSPEVYDKWKPTNYVRDRYKGDIRMRVALAKSVNTVPVKLLDTLGVDTIVDFAHAAGIEAELPANLSLALGTGEVTPFEMLRAYLTFARGGVRIEPRLIREVEASGGLAWTPEVETERVFSEDVVFVLTSMMQSVVTAGTAGKARKLGRPVAGKTGTSNDSHDAWFAGYTPELVAVTWVGFDTPARIRKGGTGGSAAVPIWVGAMAAASEGEPSPFVPPSSVLVRRIDEASGLLVPTGSAGAAYQGKSRDEYFVDGTAPTKEAIPAELPKGDVILGLYDDATPADDDPGGDPPEGPAAPNDGEDTAPEEIAAAEPDSARKLPPSGGSALPSLDDIQ